MNVLFDKLMGLYYGLFSHAWCDGVYFVGNM